MTKRAHHIFLATVVFAAAFSAAPARACVFDPIAAYGEVLRFDVLRNGRNVGFHEVRFRKEDGKLIARSTFELVVRFVGIAVYRMTYESEGAWVDETLHSLDVRKNDDGKAMTMTVRRDGDALAVESPKGSFTVDGTMMPTNHWHPRVLEQSTVLNTLTGGPNAVTITPMGQETVSTGAGPRKATRYRYTGQLEVESWYDETGRWVKLAFMGRDGSEISYVCTQCGPPPEVTQSQVTQ